MKKIESYVGTAQKVSGTGEIKYTLWVNNQGDLFIQLIDNDESGTYSQNAFSVSQYQSSRSSDRKLGKLEGYNINTDAKSSVDDNNNGAFLKAALIHLLD